MMDSHLNNKRRFIGYLLLFVMSVLPMAGRATAKEKLLNIKVSTDRAKSILSCGEKVNFKIRVSEKDTLLKKGKLLVIVSNDGGKDFSRKYYDLSKINPVVVSGSMDKPGFLRCAVQIRHLGKYYHGWAGVGYEPLKIVSMTKLPKDFRKFWGDSAKKLAALPLKLTRLPKYSSAAYNSYKISVVSVNNKHSYGFITIPAGKGPFPAIVGVPGAGPGAWRPYTGWAKKGVICMIMNVHAFEPPMDVKKHNELYKALNSKKLYYLQGAPDREKYYFYSAIAGANRAINWLVSSKYWDHKHLVLQGSSQGGGFTLIMAGLNKHVTAAVVNVPALCEHAGYLAGRSSGWPRLVDIAGKKSDEYLKMSAYFDTVNFARFIKCPILFCVGFIDGTCSPGTVYAAYNTITAPKRIFNEPTMGHGWSKRFIKFKDKWIDGQLGVTPIVPLTQNK